MDFNAYYILREKFLKIYRFQERGEEAGWGGGRGGYCTMDWMKLFWHDTKCLDHEVIK